MFYLWSPKTGKVYEFETRLDLEYALDLYPEDVEVDKDTAYIKLFERISARMEYLFSNYRNLDIRQECFYLLLKRYRERGLYAPDKPFKDNERIWWSVAKKTCMYIIRQHKEIITDIDVHTLDETNPYSVAHRDTYPIEHTEGVNILLATIDTLSKSPDRSQQLMGLFAICKLQKLTDDQALSILEVKTSRLYELKRELRKILNRKI